MIVLKSKNYPKSNKLIVAMQEHAWNIYLWLFSLLMLILFYQLASRHTIFYSGVIGVFAVVILSNTFAVVRMRRTVAELGFTEGQFYIKSAYDVLTDQKPKYFPLPYSNAKKQGRDILITYFDTIILLRQEDWEEWEDIHYYFGFNRFF